ncbi:hypothetical protein EV183_004427 [Coemansia sp. RSA 2336]|nr:hypothetical protein EV183_004427 [Coemansia sp. RSA 2336]
MDLIKDSEGLVYTPQPDPLGVPTVGYGHQCRKPRCSEISRWLPLSASSAHQLLVLDILPFTQSLSRLVSSNVTLNDNQWGALVSWAFNVGSESVRLSELLRRLNAGDDPRAVVESELPRWDVGGGQKLPGLVHRRRREIELFNLPAHYMAHPWVFIAILSALAVSALAACQLPAETTRIITKYEGFYPLPQANFFNNTVMGFGHRCQEQPPFSISCSSLAKPISSADAYGVLTADMNNTVGCLESFVGQNVQLNKNQLGALVSWAFAITCELAGKSNLVTRLNNREDPITVVNQELPTFIRHEGNVVP